LTIVRMNLFNVLNFRRSEYSLQLDASSSDFNRTVSRVAGIFGRMEVCDLD